MGILHMGVFVIFSSFGRIFRMAYFVFDFDEFHFLAYGKMGDAFPRAFSGVLETYAKNWPAT